MHGFKGERTLMRIHIGERDKDPKSGKPLYQAIVDTVTPDDVVWTCRLLARLSDEQWNAAFTTGGYSPDQAARFRAKLKSKIAEGLALATKNTE